MVAHTRLRSLYLRGGSLNKSEIDTETTQQNTVRRSVAITIVISLVLFGILNWPYQYKFLSSSTIGSPESTQDFKLDLREPPRMAGLPFRFYIQHSDTSLLQPVSHFSLSALVYNVAIATFICALMVWYVFRRTRRLATGKLKRKSLTIADMLLSHSCLEWRLV